jgi:hypothetical protein
MWGWLEEVEAVGSKNNLLPTAKSREQIQPDHLLPTAKNREQNNNLLPILDIVTVRGQKYFLTPNKNRQQLPNQTTWYDIKSRNKNQYLYLRWREGGKQRSRLLGRIDPLKYSD